MNTSKTHSFHKLKKRFDTYHKNTVKTLQKNHSKALQVAQKNTLAVVGGAILLGSSATAPITILKNKADTATVMAQANRQKDENTEFLKEFTDFKSYLLEDPNNLTEEEELKAQELLSTYFNTSVKVTLDSNRMNRVWGYFGQEQHLYRWVGDTLSAHNEGLDHGIAPGRGAFGYFDNAEQEKYYIAAPIHLLPNWNTDWSTLKPWYRYRKVLVYNPKNDRAVVAVIGDAGPASFTGKHFGGSPELMEYLDMYDGSAKSKAVVLFLEDGENTPLGPVESSFKVVQLANTN